MHNTETDLFYNFLNGWILWKLITDFENPTKNQVETQECVILDDLLHQTLQSKFSRFCSQKFSHISYAFVLFTCTDA